MAHIEADPEDKKKFNKFKALIEAETNEEAFHKLLEDIDLSDYLDADDESWK